MSTAPVVVLAGGIYQLPLIHAIRRRGLSVVLFDADPAAPGFRYANTGRTIDIADSAAVIDAARSISPRAIASIVSEFSVRSTAAAAAALGLPGIGVETAQVCTDKFLMRTCFKHAGMPCPAFAAVTRPSDGREAVAEVGFPLVVKPVDSAGSRGVRRVDDVEDLEASIEFALSNSRQHRAIIEGFLEGIECTVETMTVNGQTEVLGISDKIHLPFPHCVSISLTYPPDFDAITTSAVTDAAKQALRAVGLQDGPAHIEVMLTASGPVVIELAARGGGFRIFSDILPLISGIDPVEAVIDQALGLKPSVAPTRKRAAVLRFFNPGAKGILRSVHGVEAARQIPNILDVVVDARVGAPLRGITRDGERPGYIIAVADEREQAVSAADVAEHMVTFEIDPEDAGAMAGEVSTMDWHRGKKRP